MAYTSKYTKSGSGYVKVYKDSVTTPGYRKLLASGKILPENPFFYSVDEGATPGRQVSDNGTSFYTSYFDPFGPGLDSQEGFTSFQNRLRQTPNSNGDVVFSCANESLPVGVSNPQQSVIFPGEGKLLTLASNKLVKKLSSKDIDLGVAMGEARETAHMLQSALLCIFTAQKRLRKGDMSGVIEALGISKTKDPRKQRYRDVADKAAQTQLLWSYGVRPLMSDIEGAVKALDKRYESPTIVTTRAVVRREFELFYRTIGRKDSPQQLPDVHYLFRGWVEVREKLTFQVNNPLVYRLSQLGLTNPLSVAYELITLSFVLDWFIPIGDWLAGLVPPQGVTAVRRCSTIQSACKFDGLKEHKRGFVPMTSWQKHKQRRVSSTIPRYHLVGATFDLSASQIRSGLALLWTFGASEKSQAKAYNDAVKLNREVAATGVGKLARQYFGSGNRKGANPKFRFPETYSHI